MSDWLPNALETVERCRGLGEDAPYGQQPVSYAAVDYAREMLTLLAEQEGIPAPVDVAATPAGQIAADWEHGHGRITLTFRHNRTISAVVWLRDVSDAADWIRPMLRLTMQTERDGPKGADTCQGSKESSTPGRA